MIFSSEVIKSKQNPALVRAASWCKDRKYRERDSVFVCDGYKLFCEAAAASAPIVQIYVTEQAYGVYGEHIRALLDDPRYADTHVTLLSEECFSRLTSEKSPQGIVTIIKYLDNFKRCIKINRKDSSQSASGRCILLSSVRDPQNVGAMLRSALAFGYDSVILSEDCADVFHPRCVRAAMGAVFHLALYTCTDMEGTIEELRRASRRVFAAELTPRAQNVREMKICATDVFVIGNEGRGIPPSLSDRCDGSVYIPVSVHTESLNAAVAASVLMWVQSSV